jgi:plasmid stabilization system protein ParE
MAEVRWHRRAGEVVQVLPGAIADRILQATRLLGQFPELGKRVYDPEWPSLGRIVVRDWNVIYAYDSLADVVTVMGVIAPGTGRSVQ